MKKELVIELIVFLFVVLFLYAGGSKLTEYNNFVGQMGKSPMLTDFAPTLAWMVPAIEIMIAIMLIIDKTKLLAMYASFCLMIAFTLYIIAILTFSKDLPCSCGGILSTFDWKEHLMFNIVFTGLAVVGIVLLAKKSQQKRLNAFL